MARTIGGALCAVLAVSGLIMLFSGLWLSAVFGQVTVEQLLFVFDGEGGVIAANSELVVQFVLICLVLPVLLVVAAVAAFRLVARSGSGRRAAPPPALLSSIALSLSALLVLLTGGAVFADRISLQQHIAAANYDDTIESYYAEPALVSAPEQPVNLILIYLESFDDAYSDPAIMGRDLLRPLTQQTEDWMSWESFEQQPGTGWTIAGIVSSQCGIPLKSAAQDSGDVDGNAVGEEAERYLPGATCLGDVLSEQGYRNVFLGGADAAFAGKGKFLLEHGYDSVLDRPFWQRQGETDFNQWGLSDDRLLENARDTLGSLRASGQPYNMTLLTVDSHEPGLVGPACRIEDERPMRAAVQCTASEVASFLRDIERDGVLDDTAVVLMGDHLAMVGASSDFRDELRGRTDRTIFNRFSTPVDLQPSRQEMDHFSMFPTILRLMGFDFPQARLGLGVSAVDDRSTERTICALDPRERRLLLEAPSTGIYEQFWSGEALAEAAD